MTTKLLSSIRSQFFKELEKMDGLKSEEVFVVLSYHNLSELWYNETLREVLKCARVRSVQGELKIELSPVSSENWLKCPRCRRWYSMLFDESGHGMVCERCDRVMHMQDFDAQFEHTKKVLTKSESSR